MAKTAKTKRANRVEATVSSDVLSLSAMADPKLMAAWRGAIGKYRAALEGESASWDKRYELLAAIIDHDPPLYLAGGYQHLRSFLAAEAPGESERTIRSKMRVARYFAPSDEAAHGVTKLDLLLGYLDAKGALPKAGRALNPDTVRLEVRVNGSVERVRFVDASAATLRSATRELLSQADGTKARQPRAVVAVRAALGKAGLGQVTVSLRGSRLTLGGIEPSELGKLAKALGAVKIA